MDWIRSWDRIACKIFVKGMDVKNFTDKLEGCEADWSGTDISEGLRLKGLDILHYQDG
jgi:hypothetical protein